MSISTYREVKGYLASLPVDKPIKVIDLVNKIKSISNHKKGTEDSFKMIKPYEPYTTADLDELWVDMSYQRRIRLDKIVNKLQNAGGFDKSAAGTVDVAVRSGGRKFVWDGFRRCLMVGICGGNFVEASYERHDDDMLENECVKREAELFAIRNAQQENMTPGEIFKAHVVAENPRAISQLRVLKKCNLDVEGTNPSGKVLSGFKAFDDEWDDFELDTLVGASHLIQSVWTSDAVLSVYLLLGLSALLEANDEIGSYNEPEIILAFKDFAKRGFKQKDLTQPRLQARPTASIAYNAAKKVLANDNGLIRHLMQRLDLSDVDVDFLENS